MKICRALVFLGMFLLVPHKPAVSGDVVTYVYDGTFDDAIFELREAIVGRGLKVDYVSHVGDMLNRTKDDVGGTRDIFANAKIFVFCSAAISRRAMEADPLNIVHCPYTVFVAQMSGKDGKVLVGHPDFPDGAMDEAERLLQDIAREVTGG